MGEYACIALEKVEFYSICHILGDVEGHKRPCSQNASFANVVLPNWCQMVKFYHKPPLLFHHSILVGNFHECSR